MSGTKDDRERDWTSAVVRLSAGVGVLYFVGYTIYVVTEWDPVFYFPPVVLLGYLISRSAIAYLWYCDRCERPAVSQECPTCGGDLIRKTSRLRIIGIYAFVVPAGAITVEFVLLLCQALVFSILGWAPVIAWYQQQWLDVTGFVGPLPLIVYTFASAVIVALVAIAIQMARAKATSLLSDR